MCVTGEVLYRQGYKVTEIGNMSFMGVFVSMNLKYVTYERFVRILIKKRST